MFDSASELPARPSLDQLRKQAKELLRAFRAGDTAAAERFRALRPRLTDPRESSDLKLADAQFILAREYGFESWAKLVRHVEATPRSGMEHFERVVNDLVSAWHGDDAALRHLNELYSSSFTLADFRVRVQQQRDLVSTSAKGTVEFTLTEARLLFARQLGFASWDELSASVTGPSSDPRSAPHGLSPTPPFYRIDWDSDTLEPRQPLSENDWETIFGVMKDLGITGLNAGQQMTDTALERLSQLDHVTRLDLGGSKRLSDNGLRHLARMPQVQHLDLSDYPGGVITDRGLEVLRQLPELRRFQMCWQGGISDAGVANLTNCDQLESVDLLGTPTGDGAINALTGKPQLRRFKSGRLVTDAGLPLLHRFPVFKSWQGGEITYELMSAEAAPNHLHLDGPFTDQGLAKLAGLDGLFGLTFFWHVSAMTPEGLRSLADLPNLGYLGCQGKLCNDAAMVHIGALPRLRMLMGQDAIAGDDGFSALSRSQTIEHIWGRRCYNLHGRGFAALAAMPALRGLSVSCKNVDDAALSSLPNFPALREFMPMDVPDDGFRHVGKCKQLEALWCMYCRDTGDASTDHISQLPTLRTYYAGQTKITDRSLEILAGMSSLERLTFWRCAGVTDVGVAALARLPRLRELHLEGLPGVTRESVTVFPSRVRVIWNAAG